MSNYFLKCKPLYLILLSSLGLGACVNFPTNDANTVSSNAAYGNNSNSPIRSELDSLTQSLKDTDSQMALNKLHRHNPENMTNNSSNSSKNVSSFNKNTVQNKTAYASQYSKNNDSNVIQANNDSNVLITIERPSMIQKDSNLSNNLTSDPKDGDTLVDNRNSVDSHSNFDLNDNNGSNSNVQIKIEPRPQKINTFDIVDDSSIISRKIDNSTLNSETILASNFASRNVGGNSSNFKVNLDWNDSVDLLFSKLSGKAGYKYATINHPRKNMIVSIHGDSLSFDDILKQAGSQISSCFDVVKIQSEGIFTLKPIGICQIN